MRLLLAAFLFAACSSTPELRLEGQSNFRDVGGYTAAGGRKVKTGEIYRSGELPKITDTDLARLEEVELKAVVNFLIPAEVEAHGRDRVPAGTREISQPIALDGLAATAHAAISSADFSKLPKEINPEVHRMLIRDARAQYAAFLRAAADPDNRPLVFHCSHGVHRTGVATALLLSALGVPWETVREDYLLSNEYREREVQARLAQLRAMAAEKRRVPAMQIDMTNVEAFYVLQGFYIDAALDEMLQRYGSVDAYLRDGLGLTDDELQRLRDELLE